MWDDWLEAIVWVVTKEDTTKNKLFYPSTPFSHLYIPSGEMRGQAFGFCRHPEIFGCRSSNLGGNRPGQFDSKDQRQISFWSQRRNFREIKCHHHLSLLTLGSFSERVPKQPQICPCHANCYWMIIETSYITQHSYKTWSFLFHPSLVSVGSFLWWFALTSSLWFWERYIGAVPSLRWESWIL